MPRGSLPWLKSIQQTAREPYPITRSTIGGSSRCPSKKNGHLSLLYSCLRFRTAIFSIGKSKRDKRHIFITSQPLADHAAKLSIFT